MSGSGADPWVVSTPRKRRDLNGAAAQTARRLSLPFLERGDTSIPKMMEQTGARAVYVETDEGPRIHTLKGSLGFHENTAGLRTRDPGAPDALVRALEPRPADRVLDATLGMACDALVVATRLTGGGAVTGVESNPLLADMVGRGLAGRRIKAKQIIDAAGRIEVVNSDHLEFLRESGDGEYDLIYLDPMFMETVAASSSMRILKEVADERPMSDETLAEARRVAKRRIVIKGRRGSFRPIEFSRIIPSGRTIFYGIIDL